MGRLAKLTSKNQITLPAEAVRQFPGVEYFEVQFAGESLALYPVRTGKGENALDRARRQFRDKGFNEKTITEAVAWARKSKK